MYKGDDLNYQEVRGITDIILNKDLEEQILNGDERAFVQVDKVQQTRSH
jgi:hypothetical protein